MPVTPGICRMYSRRTGSSAPNQRKVISTVCLLLSGCSCGRGRSCTLDDQPSAVQCLRPDDDHRPLPTRRGDELDRGAAVRGLDHLAPGWSAEVGEQLPSAVMIEVDAIAGTEHTSPLRVREDSLDEQPPLSDGPRRHDDLLGTACGLVGVAYGQGVGDGPLAGPGAAGDESVRAFGELHVPPESLRWEVVSDAPLRSQRLSVRDELDGCTVAVDAHRAWRAFRAGE